jgi:phosphoribosyl-ATP pyrophosphohydrolase/phosphoribosyl-AMP cyclohydrolase
MNEFDQLTFDENGLIPAVVQDRKTGSVLMLAYMNKESLQQTLETRETVFWSRSRQALWHKGETSGNTQAVRAMRFDCDADTLLIEVDQKGNACHTGSFSCFSNTISGDQLDDAIQALANLGFVLHSLAEVVHRRKEEMPEESYTTYLFKSGLDKILKKVGEETAETIIAAKNHNRKEIARESADLLYHLLVLWNHEGVELEDVARELRARAKQKQ